VVPKSSTYSIQRADNRICLKEFYVIGTAASKAEILYE
jgi:hypothetical protein